MLRCNNLNSLMFLLDATVYYLHSAMGVKKKQISSEASVTIKNKFLVTLETYV